MLSTSHVIRSGAFCVWLGGLCVTYLLVSDYTAGAGDLLKGFCGLAVAVSAFGLIIARHYFNSGHVISGLMGLSMWACGLFVLGMFEVGYWNETFNARANEVAVNNSTYTGKRGMIEEAQAKLKLPEYKNARNPSEVSQEINSKLGTYLKDYKGTLGNLTRNCERSFADVADKCNEVSALKLEMERGKSKAGYEDTLKNASTFIKTRQMLDTMGAAKWAQDRWGGELESWRDRVMLVFLLLLVVCRDGALYLVFTPIERKPASAMPAAFHADSRQVLSPERLPALIEPPAASNKDQFDDIKTAEARRETHPEPQETANEASTPPPFREDAPRGPRKKKGQKALGRGLEGKATGGNVVNLPFGTGGGDAVTPLEVVLRQFWSERNPGLYSSEEITDGINRKLRGRQRVAKRQIGALMRDVLDLKPVKRKVNGKTITHYQLGEELEETA